MHARYIYCVKFIEDILDDYSNLLYIVTSSKASTSL